MSGTKISLLMLPFLLASCSVEVYGDVPSDPSDFVEVVTAEEYLPSSSIVAVPQLASQIADNAAVVSLFPFEGMGNDGIREIHFYEGDAFSFPYGTLTITGTYDRVNDYYYALMGSGSSARGLVYTSPEKLDSYREMAENIYRRDYTTCLNAYLTLRDLALGELDGFDGGDYYHLELGEANIGSTVGYSCRLKLDDGDYDYDLEFNITMDAYDETSYAITDCSYRLKQIEKEGAVAHHYIKEYKFQSSALMTPFNWTRSDYTLSFVEAGPEGLGPSDFLPGIF